MNEYSQIAYHFIDPPFDPYDISIVPMELMTAGSRCELTTWMRFQCGETVYDCKPGHTGWVVEGRRRERDQHGYMRYKSSHLITLDGIDGLYRCDYIKYSKKEESDAN